MKNNEKQIYRIFNIYQRLQNNEVLNPNILANDFNVSDRTIFRDIEWLKDYCTLNSEEIVFSKENNSYKLEKTDSKFLTNKEILVISKILLESRSLMKDELMPILNKITSTLSIEERKQINNLIDNEKYHYRELSHKKSLIETIWLLTEAISKQVIINFDYTRLDGKNKYKTIKPISIMFSEYYFYLVGFDNTHSEYPIIFRVDRVSNLILSKENFSLNGKQFETGEFRNNVHFMEFGEIRKIIFKYTGSSVEALYDKLTNLKEISREKNTYIFEVTSYGNGIYRYLNSQGDNLKILEDSSKND